MGEELTTITTWAAAIASTLEGRGVDPAPLFAQAGLDYSQLADVDARYPVSGMTRLWREAAAATQCPHIGLLVAGQMQPGALHALGSALLASSSLADCFARVNRYSRMVSNAGHWVITEGDDEVTAELCVVDQGSVVGDEAVDAFLATSVRIGRMMTSNRYCPMEVSLCRSEPDASAVYAEHFRAPVSFSQPVNRLLIDWDTWTAPVRGSNPSVAQATEQIASDYLARHDKQRLVPRVRDVVMRHLPAGEPALGQIAAELHLSERSLQRKLAAEDSSYKQVLDSTRFELAKDYLSMARFSITEVAFLLGFSDLSNFNRAFRRWADQTPTAFRTSQQALAATNS